MRVAVIKQHGLPNTIVFENRSVPAVAENHYLIKIKACGLNHLDTWVRRGVEGHQFPLPLIPGSDITGVVEKAGLGAKLFKPGDRVIINPCISCGHCAACFAGNDHLCREWGLLGETADGGCQEYIAVPEKQVHQLPAQLSFDHGAVVPITYVTAWEMLVEKAQIKPGQSILIHAAGSGVSVACIQIAKLFNLQIYVTSTSDEKLQRAKVLGAHRFLNSAKESFVPAIRNLTAKQGVDVVVDHIGEPTFMDSIKVLKKGCKLVSCGATAGAKLNINWNHVFFKNIALLGSTYGPRRVFVEVLKHFESGKLTPVIDSMIKLEELPKAHEAIEQKKVFGKIIVQL